MKPIRGVKFRQLPAVGITQTVRADDRNCDLGIPAAGIVDVDILKEGGSVWTNFLKGAFVPDISQQPLSHIRSSLKQKLEATGQNMKRDGGIAILDQDDRQAAVDLFDQRPLLLADPFPTGS